MTETHLLFPQISGSSAPTAMQKPARDSFLGTVSLRRITTTD